MLSPSRYKLWFVNEFVLIIVDTTCNVLVVHIDVFNIKVYITETMKIYTVLDRLFWCVELVVNGTFVNNVSVDEVTIGQRNIFCIYGVVGVVPLHHRNVFDVVVVVENVICGIEAVVGNLVANVEVVNRTACGCRANVLNPSLSSMLLRL